MQQLLTKHHNLIKYFFIGISAAGLDVVVYFVLFNYFDWSVLQATTLSISLATVYAFTLNMLYNFKVTDNITKRFASYAIVSGVGMMISWLMLYTLSDLQGYDGNVIKVLSLPIIFVVQYLLNKKITFSNNN